MAQDIPSKDIGVIVTLPLKIKAWMDKEAAKRGLPTAAWLRMQCFEMFDNRATSKRRSPSRLSADGDPIATEPEAAEPEAIDALVAQRLAEADEAGLTAQREDPNAAPALDGTNVRALRRPAPPFSTAPAHLAHL